MSADDLKCPLAECGEKTKNGTGYAAHCRAHVLRGEANFAEDGKTLIRVPEVPIVTEPYARKLRMDAIKAGTIKAQIKLPSKSEQKHKTPSTALAKRGPGRPKANTNGHEVHIPQTQLPFDISKLNPDQMTALRQQLGMANGDSVMVEDHSCPTTRAMDRMKQAIVLTSVAEMLEDVPADQMLLMMSQMRNMPPLPRRRNG